MEKTGAELETIIGNITSSIKKWKKIRGEIRRHEPLNYFEKYWDRCGYCESFKCNLAVELLDNCPLYNSISKKYNMPYCRGNFSYPSVASRVLLYGNKKSWGEALDPINVLVSKMKRDLNKFKYKLYKIEARKILTNSIEKDNLYYALD